jgi:hypothetical protein
VVKEMIFLRDKASHLYGTGRAIWGLQRKLREHLGFFEDDSDDFGKIPDNQRNLQEGLG